MIKIIDRSAEDVAIFVIEGKLTGLEGRGSIQEKVRETLKRDVNKIILDMSRVSWIDSTGLGELIASLSSTKKSDGNLVLADIKSPVQSLLRMTNLNQIFAIYETVEEALAQVREGSSS